MHKTYVVNKEVGGPLSDADGLARVVDGLEGHVVLDAPLEGVLLRVPLDAPDGVAAHKKSFDACPGVNRKH